MITAEFISSILGGRQKAGGGYMCQCPAHDDKNPSLSVDDGDNGRPLVKCWAGCSQDAVIEALKARGAWFADEKPLAAAELKQHQDQTAKRKADRDRCDLAKHAAAELKARKILEAAVEDPPSHLYAITKGLPSGNKVRRGVWAKMGWNDALLFPIYNSEGYTVSIQAINTDGTKDFLAGGQIKGCFHPIGKIRGTTETVYIAEGVATLAAVCHVTGCPGVAAMSAGNLESVAKVIREIAPDAEIVIVADDDQKPDGSNPGRDAARKAADAVNCSWVIPAMGKKADAWDVWHEQGADGIKAMLDAATAPTFATFATFAEIAVAESEKRINIVDYDLDGAPEDIQRLRSAMAAIPESVIHGKHTASALIGYGLRHKDSGIDTAIGAALSSEWDSRNGGNSFDTFSTCDPNYSLSSPVTTGSIYDLGKKSGWDGQAPWPEPEPLISHSEALPYPMEALPEIIREAIREVVDYSQVPVALAACSAMSAVSTVVQTFVDVRRDNMLEGPVGLYTLAIAESGERKSTVDGYFTKPILEWEKEISEQYKPLLQEHAANFEGWEAIKSGLVTSIKEKIKKGQDVSKEREDLTKLNSESPVAPIVPRLLYGDTTPEKINRNLSTGWPVAGIISSEAGIIFGGHSMGKDSAMRNMAALNVFWDGKTTPTDRQTSDSYSGRPARATMGLAVQAETVRAFLEASKGLARGIGFLARFLIAWPESTQGYRPYKKSADSWPALDTFSERTTTLLHCRPPIDEQGNITPTVLTLGKDAFESWVSFYNDVEAELRPGRSMNDAKDIASKSADNAARLAGLFHFFGGAQPGEPIGNETMEAACTIASWHLVEARRFFGEIALPVEISNAVKLDQWLLAYYKDKGESSFTTRHIRQHAPNRLRSKPSFDAATQVLIEFGRARLLNVGKKKMIEVNPSLLGGN